MDRFPSGENKQCLKPPASYLNKKKTNKSLNVIFFQWFIFETCQKTIPKHTYNLDLLEMLGTEAQSSNLSKGLLA